MVDKITGILKLFYISARLDFVWLLRDTKYAIMGITADVIANLSVISSVYLIALRFGGIGGMSVDEVFFMMAFSTVTTGLFTMFGAYNNFHISRIIGRGQLEHLFIQPLSLPVQLLTCGFAPFTGGSNFYAGCLLIIIAVRKLELAVTAFFIFAFIAYVLVTVFIIVARSYLFSSLAFYAPASAEEISSTIVNDTWLLSTFPLSGMPRPIQILLVTIMPEGLMAWFPALCLLGRPPMNFSIYYPFMFAFILALLSGFIFRKGFDYYVRKGANRYVPYGFRR